MCVEDLENIILSRSELYSGARDAFADIPISPPKGRRAAVERVMRKATLDNRPATQDGEATAKDAGVVEFAMREDMARSGADGVKVGRDEAFLQADNVGLRGGVGELAADFGEARRAVGGDV